MNSQPSVSYIMLAYNQEKYVRQAVESALSQTYNNVEFIFSDDCSTDMTYEIIAELCADTEKNVRCIKNSKNVGLSRHFNQCLSISKGDVIIIAAGDDISLPDRVEASIDYFQRFPEIKMLSFNDIVISGDLITEKQRFKQSLDSLVDLDAYICMKQSNFSGASRAFKREVYEIFGDLLESCPTEDTPYILRCLMLGGALSSSRPGILYRMHSSNLSSVDSLKRMDRNPIYDQYAKDLELARLLGIVDEKKVAGIISWISYAKQRRYVTMQSNPLKKLFMYLSLFWGSRLFRMDLLNRLSLGK